MDFVSEVDVKAGDMFQENHMKAILALKQCQSSKNLQSCLKCPTLFTCDIRRQYVKAAYESMSKGQEGAFDFN